MENMKHLMLILMMVVGFQTVWAQEDAAAPAATREVASVSANSASTSDTIIDPELMNKGVWAEPYFRGPNEPARETASNESTANAINNEKLPEQYLDVVEKIPTSEPALSRSWVEYKALHDD